MVHEHIMCDWSWVLTMTRTAKTIVEFIYQNKEGLATTVFASYANANPIDNTANNRLGFIFGLTSLVKPGRNSAEIYSRPFRINTIH